MNPLQAETAGRKLMKVLVTNGLQADQWAQSAQVLQWALAEGIDGAEYIAALQYADDQDWIEDEPTQKTVRLTQAGHDVGSQP